MEPSLLVVLTVLAALIAAPALARDDCDAPVGRWQSREAVQQMAAQKGWQVERIRIDDGCYEIRGLDAQGREFKAKVDPETLQLVAMKQRERTRAREHRRDGTGKDNPPSTGAPAPGSR